LSDSSEDYDNDDLEEFNYDDGEEFNESEEWVDVEEKENMES